MFKNGKLMKVMCVLLIMLQLGGLISFNPSFALAGVDDIPEPANPEKRLLLTNKDLFLDEVFKDPKFISDWAYLSHYLGIGWCGGTASNLIGDDFTVKKVDNLNEGANYEGRYDGFNKFPYWVIEANYDENDPHADGYRADERLIMFISDADIMFDADTLEFGPALHSKLEPEAVVSKVIRNYGNNDLTSVVQSDFSDTSSTNVTHGVNIGASFGVANETEAGGKVFGIGVNHKTTISFELSAGYNWSKATMDSHTLSRLAQERVTVPPKTKMSATIYALKSKVSFPYHGDVVPVYNMTLTGFYRHKDNSSWGHDESRPDARIKFGNFSYKSSDEAVEGMTALDDLMNQYMNRSIQGNSQTDWEWVLNKYTPNAVKTVIGDIAKTKYVARINGRFNQVDGAIFQSVIKDLGPIGSQDAGLPEQTDHDSDPVHGNDSLTPPDTSSRTNLAEGKTVTSSGQLVNKGAEKAVTGRVQGINDCWMSKDKQGSMPDGGTPDNYLGEWIKVDLGAVRKIDHVSIAHAGAYGFPEYSNNRSFGVYVSDDDQYYTEAKFITDNRDDRTDIALQDEDITGRYVKVLVHRAGYFPDYDANVACIYDLGVYGYDFAPEQYNITYAGNGHTAGQVPSDNADYFRYENVVVKDNTGYLDRTGYDFAGWSTNPDGTGVLYNPGETLKLTGDDITLYAKWVDTKDVAYNKTATANHSISYHPAQNAINGTMRNLDDKWCTTNGTGAQWLEVDLGEQCDINSWMVKHAGAYGEIAGYNTKAFKLQYKDVDTWRDVVSVTNNTENVTEGSFNPFRARFVRLYITEPTNNGDPAARIFQFKVFGQPVSDDTYHVYYNGNGNLTGSIPVDDKEYRDNELVQVASNTGGLGRPGYRFIGWNTFPDGNGVDYASRSYFTISGNNDITLYAKWERDTELENVTFNKTYTVSGEMQEHPASSMLDGYIANQNDKWCTDSYPKWVRIDLGDMYEISRWIVLHAEAGGELEEYNTENFELRVSETNSDESSFRTVDFVSNNTDSFTDKELVNPVNARYVELKINTENSAMGDSFARIYQFDVFGKLCNTVSFNDNGSTGGNLPEDQPCAEGSTAVAPWNDGVLVKNDHIFIGWNTAADGSGTSYNQGDTFTMGADDLVLYAEWAASEFSNVAIGKTSSQSSTSYGWSAERANDGITQGDKYAGQVTRTDYETNPWWKVDLGGNYEIDSINVFSMLDNGVKMLDYYEVIVLDENEQVVWSEIQSGYPDPNTSVNTSGATGRYVKIQLRKYGSLQLAEVEVYGKEAAQQASPMAAMSYDMPMLMSMDMPVLTTAEYTVSYDGNGSEAGTTPVDEVKYLVNGEAIVLGNLNKLSKEGYDFTGWNTSADGSGITYLEGDIIGEIKENVVLFAQWAEKVEETVTPEALVEGEEVVVTPEAPAEGEEKTVEPEAPAEGEKEEVTPETPVEGEEEAATPEAPAEGEEETVEPEAPAEGEEEAVVPDAPAEGEEEAVVPDAPAEGEEEAVEPEAPAEGEEEAVEPEAPAEGEEAVAPEAPVEGEEEAVEPEAPAEGEEETVAPEAPVEEVEQP